MLSLSNHSWISITVVGVSLYWILRRALAHLRVAGLRSKAVFITSCDCEWGRVCAFRLARIGAPVYAGYAHEEVGCSAFSILYSTFCRLQTKTMLERELVEQNDNGTAQLRLVPVPLDIRDERSIANAVKFIRRRGISNTRMHSE